ncbi:MAG TPA: hypothetical protein PKC84_18175, partial [Paracoccaceae bacterium]|nr:hypothetical protein [Paracoccaceae bacterium]
LASPEPARADAMAAAMASARTDCAAEGGVLELAEGAAQMLDLTGDGTADDALVWELGGFCAPHFGYRGGTGGAALHVAVGEKVQVFGALGWTVQDLVFNGTELDEGEVAKALRVLLLAVHGSACDSYGAAPCVHAVVWNAGEGQFLSVMPPFVDEEADPADE